MEFRRVLFRSHGHGEDLVDVLVAIFDFERLAAKVELYQERLKEDASKGAAPAAAAPPTKKP